MTDYLTLVLRLYIEFFKTGLFSIGGGPATLPFLSDMARRTQWFTQAQLADMVAVAESTPGPIGVNAATYVGHTVAGIPGGIIATLGLITPSLIIILLISMVLTKFRESHFVNTTFYFLRPASTGLIFNAFVSLSLMAFFTAGETASLSNFKWVALPFGVVVFILTNFVKRTKKLHPIVWIGVGAVFGIIFL